MRWQREASALLARSALESYIVGMYCLHAEDPMEQLRGQNGRHLASMLQCLVDSNLVSKELVTMLVVEAAEGSTGRLPKVEAMAEFVAESSEDPSLGRSTVPLTVRCRRSLRTGTASPCYGMSETKL
jgi:hypothetical protein